VKFSTRWFRYDRAYWVRLDNFVPGTLATIDARFTGVNMVEVATSGLDAFTLSLEGHPQFIPGQKISVKVDGKTFSAKTADAISFSKINSVWSNSRFTPGLTSKQKGAEGPMYAAVTGSHIYVYGTAGDPSPEELAARRAQAAAAADWTGMGGRIMVFPRVIADKEIRSSDYVTSNLVLFGTRETNTVIEKFADNLPVHLSKDSTDYGLVYIFPLNRHYVLINSGLPWWTPPKNTPGQAGYAFMGSKVERLKKLQDFILFREAPDNIIVEGVFDSSWKLTGTAAEALKATGVINVK
jgi:hypothetical protein